MNMRTGGVNFIRQAEVVARLARELPADSLLFQEETTRGYECDGLSAYREIPMAVALPANEAEVVAILRACHDMKVPVIARGAGTGLSGGALPSKDGVLLSLAKMKKILAVDPYARIARVQPGVRNLAISEAAAPYGLYYAPDPSSQIACTIGGNVAENSGGVHCLKYGLTVHNVMRVRGVTMEGEIIELGGEALDAPGYDLLALAIGSEGMLAVVTEVTVKLVPKPEVARVILASFADVRTAGEAVASIIAEGIIPAGLEMMDKPATRAVEEYVHAGYDLDAAAILLCESDGTPEEVEEEIARMKAVLERTGATSMRVSQQRAGAPEGVGRPQGRVPGGGPHLARLLLHGRHHPAQAPRRDPRVHRADGEEVRPALPERVPRRRRQPASADPVRRQRSRSAAPHRAVRRPRC